MTQTPLHKCKFIYSQQLYTKWNNNNNNNNNNKKKTISPGRKFWKSNSYLRFINISNKLCLLNSLIREIMSAIPNQAVKNLHVSTITVLIKSVLIAMCVWTPLLALIYSTLISLWILITQLSNFISVWNMSFFMNNMSLNMNWRSAWAGFFYSGPGTAWSKRKIQIWDRA